MQGVSHYNRCSSLTLNRNINIIMMTEVIALPSKHRTVDTIVFPQLSHLMPQRYSVKLSMDCGGRLVLCNFRLFYICFHQCYAYNMYCAINTPLSIDGLATIWIATLLNCLRCQTVSLQWGFEIQCQLPASALGLPCWLPRVQQVLHWEVNLSWCFETQGRCFQEFKTEVLVTLQKGLKSSKI